MYTNILVPVVFDEHQDTQASYQVAHALAGEGAKFTVVHVLETIPSYATVEIPAEVLAKVRLDVEKSLVQSAKALPGAVPTLISGLNHSVHVSWLVCPSKCCHGYPKLGPMANFSFMPARLLSTVKLAE